MLINLLYKKSISDGYKANFALKPPLITVFSCLVLLMVTNNASADTLYKHPAISALYNMPLVRLSYTYHLETDINDTPVTVGINSMHAAARVPIYRWDSGAVAINGRYNLHVFKLDNTISDILTDYYKMHRISLAIGLMQTLNSRWVLTIGLMPNLSSDFKEFDKDVLFLEGFANAGWAYSDSLSFRFGVAVHNRFGMYLPIPVLGLAYQPHNSCFQLNALLPKLVRATFHVTDRIDLETFAGLDSYVWDVNQKNLRNTAKYMKTKIGAGINLQLWKGFFLRLTGGIIPYCRFDSYGPANSSNTVEYYNTASMVPFFKTEFYISPREWLQSRN